MSKLPSLKPRDVIAALKRVGFVEHHQKGGHLHLWNEGLRRIVTIPVHPGDIKRGTLNAIVRQSGLTVDQFRDLL